MSKDTSKFLSYVLRHAPDSIGVKLDAQGWIDIDELLRKAAHAGHRIDRATLLDVVATSDKKRFTLSENGQRIRAAQGHSVQVGLGLAARMPPDRLYHGTAHHTLDAIMAEGLKPGSRQQVHLSLLPETARTVGARHGKPVVLTIDAARMYADGLRFQQADNGVWLTDHVPPAYLSVEQAGV